MTAIVDVCFIVLMFLGLVALLVGIVRLSWPSLPARTTERLLTTLRRVRGQQALATAGPPIYTVRLNGELLYASGKTDVEAYCWYGLMQIRFHLLDQCTPEEPLEIVFMRGKETIVVQIARE
jgi:hypothetical protein